jgi:hypothetical protein
LVTLVYGAYLVIKQKAPDTSVEGLLNYFM